MTCNVQCAHTEMVELSKLIPNPKNCNSHSDAQIKRLAEIISFQGQRAPIVVSKRSGFIVKGHARLSAIQLLKWEKAAVDYQDYESDAMEFADMVADNEISRWAELNVEQLNIDIKDFPDLKIELLGLEDLSILKDENEGLTDPDSVPETPENPVSRLGDLWLLGNHRLLNGDCTVKENIDLLMNGEKADMVFTDPPYNHASEEKLVCQSVSQAMKTLANSEWDKNFDIAQALESIDSALSENSTTYIFTSWHLAGEIWAWMKKRSNHSSYCVWHKPNPRPSLMKRHWTWSTELVCYMTRGKHTFNFPESGHALNIWDHNKEKKSNFTGHPTQKPVEVCEIGILHSSNPGHLVLDLFGGSGSTLISCEKNDRRCFMSEIDPHY